MIKINSNTYNRPISLRFLGVGDTFLMEGNLCTIIKRNGYLVVLDLNTGKDYCSIHPNNSFQQVIPVELLF